MVVFVSYILNLQKLDPENTTLQELRNTSLKAKNLSTDEVEVASENRTLEDDKVWHLTKTESQE